MKNFLIGFFTTAVGISILIIGVPVGSYIAAKYLGYDEALGAVAGLCLLGCILGGLVAILSDNE